LRSRAYNKDFHDCLPCGPPLPPPAGQVPPVAQEQSGRVRSRARMRGRERPCCILRRGCYGRDCRLSTICIAREQIWWIASGRADSRSCLPRQGTAWATERGVRVLGFVPDPGQSGEAPSGTARRRGRRDSPPSPYCSGREIGAAVAESYPPVTASGLAGVCLEATRPPRPDEPQQAAIGHPGECPM
jgi:hypothetical protein